MTASAEARAEQHKRRETLGLLRHALDHANWKASQAADLRTRTAHSLERALVEVEQAIAAWRGTREQP